MKRHISVILLLFVMPMLLHSVTEETVTLTRFSMKPLPFNDRRDPLADSPYNVFDGDLKTSALYSNFTIEFDKPVTIDQLKIINGNASKELFKKHNRERDIEITLYAIAVKPDKKENEKKKKKNPPQKKDDKQSLDKNKKNIEPEKKSDKTSSPDKKATDIKPSPEKNEKTKPEIKKEKSEDEIKKPVTPEKIVIYDDSEMFYNENIPDDVKLYFTAGETVTETKKDDPEKILNKKTPEKKKIVEKTKPVESKKNLKKKTAPAKNVKTKQKDNKNKPVKQPVSKNSSKVQTTPEKGKVPDKNIIEIIDSKKDQSKTAASDTALEDKKNEAVKTEIKKNPVDENEIVKIEPDNPAEKIEIPEIKKTKPSIVKSAKKTSVKSGKKQAAKETAAKKKPEKKQITAKDELNKKNDKNRIEIIDSKDKSKKAAQSVEKKKTSDDKKNADSIKTAEVKKTAIPENKKAENGKPADKKEIEKKKTPVIADKKDVKKEIKKADKEKIEDSKTEDAVVVKKMTGVVKIENDKNGRVFVYTSLKDSMESQSIDLKGEYTITKIDLRTRDDEYYTGGESDRSGITEIGLFNNGKRIIIQGIDEFKKAYAANYNKTLYSSIAGKTFVMLENNDIALRVVFRKDGKLEFHDRYKCARKGDADCTALAMPDAWRVTDGKLFMRYHTIWRNWKYELDSQSDMTGAENDPDPSRWMKIYYKTENGFADKYLDLVRSEDGIWAE